MKKDMSRRSFLKASVAGTAGAVVLNTINPFISTAKAEEPAFEGRKKFAGVHNVRYITDDLVYLGASDRRLALFENVYPIPRGVSYNAYLLLDEKTVLFDTVDRAVSGQFFENLEYALGGRTLDYFVINHMEPDHCSAMTEVIARYPKVKLIYSKTAEKMITQFFGFSPSAYGQGVDEGAELVTGRHKLIFLMAPMVHWPEVMMTYDATDKTLFSADAFGTFGALDGNLFADEVNFEEEWLPDARRYYCNIVGKYGPQVQNVLKKASTVEIKTVCPLHGPVWRENLGWIIEKYDLWSRYEPEDKGSVMVVYGSIYGGTESAAGILATQLSMNGVQNVKVYDVSKTHDSELIAEAFRCSCIVFASITYNNDLFTPMKNFMNDLLAHNMQNRDYAFIQNGTWSPVSAAKMQAIVDGMTNMRQVGKTITLLSTTTEENYAELKELGAQLSQLLTGETAAPAPEAAPAEAAASKWVCSVCGYVHEGDTLPEDYKCPLCGVGPEKFIKG